MVVEQTASNPVNPDDFVIARKRKKYKFAKFHNAPNCYELEEWSKRRIDFVEVGAGTALFSVELAAQYPDKQFLAVDVKADRLQKGAYTALERGIMNVSFVRARADQILELVEQSSAEGIWLTFPDPFPRERSARRRMTHGIYLDRFEELLKKDGAFYLKHDNDVFFMWSLEQLVARDWRIVELSSNLHDSELSDDYKIMTTYEKRWMNEGLQTNFVKALTPQN